VTGRLVLGEPATGGESGGAWHGTFDGHPVVVKRGEAEARPRLESISSLMDRLRDRGVPTPSYTLLDDDGDELVYVQTVLPGALPRRPMTAQYVEDVVTMSELLADVTDVPRIRSYDWPTLLQHSLAIGEDGWCRHEPMRAYSDRTRAIVEHAEAHGAAMEVASVPTTDAVHLDLHPANTLVHGGRLSGIIDWDGVLPGDRWFDLVYFAHHVELWRGDDTLTSWLWPMIEAAVPPQRLGTYAAHIALRTVEWQVSRHTAADVERTLTLAEHLVARYP